jgi:hypothetical protein
MYTMYDAPSDRDYLEQFAGSPENEEDPDNMAPAKRKRIQYRAACIECKQTSLWQGRKGSDNWANGHEKLSGHPVKLETRDAQ